MPEDLTIEDWKRTAQTFQAALDLVEAQIARALNLDAEEIINEHSVAMGTQRLYAIQCTEVALAHMRRIFGVTPMTPDRTTESAKRSTFTLTPDEAQTVLNWYYSQADDIIVDDRDRQLSRRLDHFLNSTD